jgi:hypothetical protein
MTGRSGDIVLLNVGGTPFTSSVSTLSSSSSYFERRLSTEWRDKAENAVEPLFIDQDPELFSVLLSYMRLGSIDADKLTTPVLLLAVFFGMEKLIQAVRVEARQSKLFEEMDLRLFDAARAASLIDDCKIKKKFATIVIYDPESFKFIPPGAMCNYVVRVEIQSDNGAVETVPNCVTFIDGLNHLSKLGYTIFERDKLEKIEDYVPDRVRMWFSKITFEDSDDDTMASSSRDDGLTVDTGILRGKNSGMRKAYPREFCCLIEQKQEDLSIFVSLYANIRSQERTVQVNDIWDGSVRSERVCATMVGAVESKLKTYNWLEKHGYHVIEPEITHAYNTAIAYYGSDYRCTANVWSRPQL